MARKAYKPLYLASQHALREAEDRLALANAALKELNEALSPYGRTVLEHLKGDGEIRFAPLEFVAARAFMEANQRLTYPNGGYSQLYTWKGRPIYKDHPRVAAKGTV